jgi:hypothetical protein
MDLRTAEKTARYLSSLHDDLVVSGIKQVRRPRRRPGWAIDLVNRRTGKSATLDEKGYWPRLINEILPGFAEEKLGVSARGRARTQGRDQRLPKPRPLQPQRTG